MFGSLQRMKCHTERAARYLAARPKLTWISPQTRLEWTSIIILLLDVFD
jgi:hypothetical protein